MHKVYWCVSMSDGVYRQYTHAAMVSEPTERGTDVAQQSDDVSTDRPSACKVNLRCTVRLTLHNHRAHTDHPQIFT